MKATYHTDEVNGDDSVTLEAEHDGDRKTLEHLATRCKVIVSREPHSGRIMSVRVRIERLPR